MSFEYRVSSIEGALLRASLLVPRPSPLDTLLQ
jgi:hypothetical protein